jgi:hypothetical protein
MKYLLIVFCLVLCSCEHSVDGTCVPIHLNGFKFNSQEGTDSIIAYDYRWSFTDVREEEGCEVKPETIECPWFSLVKKDSIVFASVKQNDTGKRKYEHVEIKKYDGPGRCDGRRGSLTIFQCPEQTDIELSKEEFLFSAEGGVDSAIIITDRTFWLDHLSIFVHYGNVVHLFDPDKHGFDFSNYVSKHSYIKDIWFNINIIDEKKIIFSINRNESGKERSFGVTFPVNCGPTIKVIQSAD